MVFGSAESMRGTHSHIILTALPLVNQNKLVSMDSQTRVGGSEGGLLYWLPPYCQVASFCVAGHSFDIRDRPASPGVEDSPLEPVRTRLHFISFNFYITFDFYLTLLLANPVPIYSILLLYHKILTTHVQLSTRLSPSI